jgi:hypothetical protein
MEALMLKRDPLQKAATGLFALFLLPLLLSAQTSPEAFLGFKVGADRKLADYGQVQAYFNKLAGESPKVRIETIGTSTLKRPMIMAVITAEENMARLDEYRAIAKKLKDPRALTAGEAEKLAKEGKIIVIITCSLHAEEIAASQMSMELAYKLVTGDTPFDAADVLRNVIFLLVPTANPDGLQMEVDWYKKYLGTKFEGGEMPWLYHYYAGHDDNRDWFMGNLSETRAVNKVLYHDWFPQIHLDEHQMGSDNARLFIPPYMNPPVPNVQPLVWRAVNLIGANMAYDLQKNGFKGVVHGRSFTGWYIGACDDTSWLHNIIGLLSETASTGLATPINIEPTEIPTSYTQKRMEFPDPWPGGWWRLRDIVDYELTLSLSLLRTADLYKEEFLFNSYRMNKNSIETVEKSQPYAFIIPAVQHDYPTMLKMLDVLQFGSVEIQRARKDFTAEGRVYPAGSFVVLLAQPNKPYAWALLEKQKYPDMREYPGGPPIFPYDNAGWTLPLQMGVLCDQVDKPFEAELEKIEQTPVPAVVLPGELPAYLVFDSRANASFAAAFALLKEKAEIYRSKEKIAENGYEAAPGSFIVKNGPGVQKALPALLEKLRVSVYPLADAAGVPKSALKNPRIGLYQSWWSNMDEGWTRYVFDDLGVPYTTLHNADFKAPKTDKSKAKEPVKIDLKTKFDVIVFAGEDYDIIKSGKIDPASPWARCSTPLPPEYEGGLEKEGVDNLKAFIENGGILVTLNDACKLAIKDFEPPARDILEKVERTKFFCPMSILKLSVDNMTPIGYGMSATTPAVFNGSPALETWVPLTTEWDRKVVASYPEDNILLSGWMSGEETIARKAAVVDTQFKKGRIVLIGIACQYRAESHGTYKFLLNALLYPEKP